MKCRAWGWVDVKRRLHVLLGGGMSRSEVEERNEEEADGAPSVSLCGPRLEYHTVVHTTRTVSRQR